MTTPVVYLSPVWIATQFTDLNNALLNGGWIATYEAGSTSVHQTTYTSNTGLVPNPNPIHLDSSGVIPNELWLIAGEAYNLVLYASDGTTILRNADNVIAPIPSSTGSVGPTIDIWNASGVPTYAAPTQFILAGNQTVEYAIGNRVKYTLGLSGTFYGTVTAVSYTNPNTTITLQTDTTALTGALSAVYWSALVSNGIAVDAGGVSYTTGISYTTPGTVGYEISQGIVSLATIDTAIAGLQEVWETTNSGNNYSISPIPSATAYTANRIYCVDFNAGNTGTSTINVSGLGAVPLKQYTPTGTLSDVIITTGLTSTILYDGAEFILQNPLPSQGLGWSVDNIAIGASGGGFDESTVQLPLTGALYPLPSGAILMIYSIQWTLLGGYNTRIRFSFFDSSSTIIGYQIGVASYTNNAGINSYGFNPGCVAIPRNAAYISVSIQGGSSTYFSVNVWQMVTA